MDPAQLILTVHSFYEQAFDKLIMITFGLITFIGVVVPLFLGWAHMRSLRQEKESILREITHKTKADEENIRRSIEANVEKEMQLVRTDFENRIEELSRELKKSSASAAARTLHLQGNNLLNTGKPFTSIDDLAHAARLYFEANDEPNAQSCIDLVINNCLLDINQSEYVQYKVDKHCEKLLEKLRDSNQNGRYLNTIEKLESAMASASTRE